MNALVQHTPLDVVVRSNLDFKLDDIPRFWFGDDPFRTRIFDALSLTFPEGERYFIESVRLFRDKIEDPELQQKVKDFIRQEAQHGIAHDKMNALMKAQGMPLDAFTARLKKIFRFELTKRSPQYNIAMTAAAEHLTALMAETFYHNKSVLAEAHPYARALFAWHAIEEMEHRDVAFDVMKQVGEVPEATRKFALAFTTVMMFGFTMYRANIMLDHDGFSRRERFNMFRKGLPWFFGKQGIMTRMKSEYLAWFNKDFHPSQHPVIHQYDVWLKVYEETGDPIKAGHAFWQAGY